jgi:hypothetical protein
MPRGRGKRGCAAAGIAAEMEPLPAARVGLPHDAGDLGVEVVLDRRSVAGVDLEILRHGLDLASERVEQRTVGQLGRQDGAREQDHACDGSSFRASTSSTKASTTGCAGSMVWPPSTHSTLAEGMAAARTSAVSR